MNNDLYYLTKQKTPSTLDNYVGIEIEFIVKKKIETNNIKKELINNKLHYICNLGYDNSIRCEDEKLKEKLKPELEKLQKEYNIATTNHYNTIFYSDKARDLSYDKINKLSVSIQRLKSKYQFAGYGKELRILCRESDLKNIIFKVVGILNNNNAMVNSSCGLHVHLDMRNRDFIKSVKTLFKYKKQIFKSIPKQRLNSTYCVPNKKISFRSGKHYAINTGSFYEKKTIEVRVHEATLSATEIFNWCKYLITLVDDKPLNKMLSNYISRRTNVKSKAS